MNLWLFTYFDGGKVRTAVRSGQYLAAVLADASRIDGIFDWMIISIERVIGIFAAGWLLGIFSPLLCMRALEQFTKDTAP